MKHDKKLKKFKPLSQEKDIPYLDWDNITRIKSHVYVGLESSGLDPRMNVTIWLPKTSGRSPKFTADLIVYHKMKPICLVAVGKDSAVWDSEPRQMQRYRSCGVPVYLIWDIEGVPTLLRKIKKLSQSAV